MLLLDRILTHIVNHLSNTSYHFQYLYYPGGNETGAKPNLITCITEIFLSVGIERSIEIDTIEYQQTEKIETELEDVDRIRIRKVYACCPGWHSGGS